jgi:hypothetical protein
LGVWSDCTSTECAFIRPTEGSVLRKKFLRRAPSRDDALWRSDAVFRVQTEPLV